MNRQMGNELGKRKMYLKMENESEKKKMNREQGK